MLHLQLVVAHINEPGGTGNLAPLHFAVLKGRAQLVQILLEHKADVSVKFILGDSLQNSWREAIIRPLLLKRADVVFSKLQGLARVINVAETRVTDVSTQRLPDSNIRFIS